jgi:hypothetical protein
MSFTFDEYKQKVEKYLQEVIDYNYRGNDGQTTRDLTTLKDECTGYKQTFDTQCKTPKELMDFRMRMENTWEQFCAKVSTPAEGSWEKSMFLSIKSKMDACISYLKQMERLIQSGVGPDLTKQTASLDTQEQISKSLAELKRFL